MNVSRTIKRTRDGKRVLIGISQNAIDFSEKLLKKYQKTYLDLWKKESLSDTERELFDKIDRVLGKARRRERKIVGTWN